MLDFLWPTKSPIQKLKDASANNLILSEADIYNSAYLPWYVKLASNVLTSTNNTPKHVAFIMDGNRRFAKTKLGTSEVIQGHSAGFDKLCEILIWCRICQIETVSVYAFSTENFKRSPTEVLGLMKLFEEKLDQIISETENLTKLKANSVKINFVGQIEQLPEKLRAKISKIHAAWPEKPTCTLNVCLAYVSKDEIVQAVEKTVENCRISPSGDRCSLSDQQFCQKFKENLQISEPFPDLLIRTSGETRLSDFMLYQVFENTRLEFIPSLWPDMTFFDFFKCILNWQVFNSNFD